MNKNKKKIKNLTLKKLSYQIKNNIKKKMTTVNKPTTYSANSYTIEESNKKKIIINPII